MKHACALIAVLLLSLPSSSFSQTLRDLVAENHYPYIPSDQGRFPTLVAIPGCSGISSGNPTAEESNPELREDDLLFISADHGCDPTDVSTDHTREFVPLIITGPGLTGRTHLGTSPSFADLGCTVADYVGAPFEDLPGRSLLDELTWAPAAQPDDSR